MPCFERKGQKFWTVEFHGIYSQDLNGWECSMYWIPPPAQCPHTGTTADTPMLFVWSVGWSVRPLKVIVLALERACPKQETSPAIFHSKLHYIWAIWSFWHPQSRCKVYPSFHSMTPSHNLIDFFLLLCAVGVPRLRREGRLAGGGFRPLFHQGQGSMWGGSWLKAGGPSQLTAGRGCGPPPPA